MSFAKLQLVSCSENIIFNNAINLEYSAQKTSLTNAASEMLAQW
jgi:hypothetical protein